MDEHLRAFTVVLAIAIVIFLIIRKGFRGCIKDDTIKEWRNTWFALTCAAFLSHSFWLFAASSGLILLAQSRNTTNPAALFLVCLFAVPAVEIQMPGLGLVNYLLGITHPRLLALFLLLPTFFSVLRNSDVPPFGKLWADRLLVLFCLLVVAMELRVTTLTDTARQGAYALIDVFLPYYVISRSVRKADTFRTVIAAFVVAALLLAGFAAFELARHWNLYSALIPALDSGTGFGAYLGRDGMLRASASTGHSIALGFVMSVAIGLYLFLQSSIRNKLMNRLAWFGLFIGLMAPLSRGPWVGTVVIFIAYIITGRAAIKSLMTFALLGAISLPLLASLPFGERVISLLPFVGSVDKGNIDYREKLIDNAWIVIQRNPLLGSADYLSTPEMESMRQGQGIIDIVNTYVGITLEYGFVGLILFSGFFLIILYGVFKAMKSIRASDQELYLLGRALFATLTGILFMIFTVSSITVIPIVYWSLASLCVAYIQFVRRMTKDSLNNPRLLG